MSIWPVYMSGRFPAMYFTVAVLVACIMGGDAVAQSDQAGDAIVDPLDDLCAKIGRPLMATEIVEFEGHVVRGISTDYREVVGNFTEARARSVRYLADGKRTAQFVYAEGREICLTAPDRDEITCGVPLVCSSDEADYVMVDDNDAPFLLIDKPQDPDPDAPSLPEDYDWVTYAGGTVRMVIEGDRLGGRRSTPVRNIYFRDRCRVGSGHPALDDAFAYYWQGPGCNSTFASGKGKAIFLSQSGNISALSLAPGSGIRTEKGSLYWSFSNQPIALAIVCSNSDNSKIPTSATEVANIVARIVLPATIRIGEPLVYGKLVAEMNRYIERICGTPPIPNETEYVISRSPTPNMIDLALVWTGSDTRFKHLPSPALERFSSIGKSAAMIGVDRFAVYIRKMIEAERKASVLAAIKSPGRLPNVAEGMRTGDAQALVALTDGLTIRMPWAWTYLTYADGQFKLSWKVSSTDPASEFFKNRRQRRGWASIEGRLPAGPDRVSLQLTCLLPSAEARSLPPERMVDVEATLISYKSSKLVLECAAP